MEPEKRHKIIAVSLLVLALLLAGVGMTRSYRIYDESDAEFGLVTFTRIGQFQLNIDATFSGVVRKDGKLYTTWDRSQPRGKRSCPT
jgi:hypothetical protein